MTFYYITCAITWNYLIVYGLYVNQSTLIIKKYKTFSDTTLIDARTTPAGRSVFIQFRVFPIFTSVDITVYQYGKNVLYFFYNIAQRTLTEEWREIFHVDIEFYQHGS